MAKKIPSKKQPDRPTRKRKEKGKTDPPNPKGRRYKVLGADGKVRWEWK